ncbi:MAG: DUF4065 domain-containing protein [Deltaproteobacteria bacterium]|nr:DUF4065 domain-containing protein [Deltaproteobacteria bacterium]
MTELPENVPVANSAIAVANWFIGKNQAVPSKLTHLKIQKMLYFAQGWHLAYFNVPLFEDPIEAWKYGPVVRPVYRALSSRPKNENITDTIEGYVLQGTDYQPLGIPEMSFRDENLKDFMQSIWNSYSERNAWELVAMSHAKGSPWDTVANAYENAVANEKTAWYSDYYDLVIPVELMRSYFKSFLTEIN